MLCSWELFLLISLVCIQHWAVIYLHKQALYHSASGLAFKVEHENGAAKDLAQPLLSVSSEAPQVLLLGPSEEHCRPFSFPLPVATTAQSLFLVMWLPLE